MSSGRTALVLSAVLVLAAVLRVVGLDWGLRHPPHSDERVFVESVWRMIEAGDLDHRYYEYPGLVFYVLLPVLWLVHGEGPPGPGAYLAARAVMAAFGVASCALLYRLGREVLSVPAGLFAALLLAVSPVAVETAHMLRPDVVLQALTIAALIAIRQVGAAARGDLLAGSALGLAAAAKFSGAFLLPSYLAARALAPGPRGRGLLLAAMAALLTFALASPFAFLHLPQFLDGVGVQLSYHYEDVPREPVSFPVMVLRYLGVWVKALGLPAALLSAVGLFVSLRSWRSWLPLLLLPATTLLVLATSDVRYDRFLLPALSVAFLLGAAGVKPLSEHRLALPALALLTTLSPLLSSIGYLRGITGAQTRDRALDWVEANVPPGMRILSTVALLGLDTTKQEVLLLPRLAKENRRQALECDLVLTTPLDDGQALEGFPTRFVAQPEMRYRGRAITISAVPPLLRPAYEPVGLTDSRVSASENGPAAALASDGRLDTAWSTLRSQERGDWVQVDLRAPVRLARLELLPGEARFAARRLRVLVSEDGHRFSYVPVLPGRPEVERQILAPPSQVLLLSPPLLVRALRLEQWGFGWRRRWAIAELRLWALPREDTSPRP